MPWVNPTFGGSGALIVPAIHSPGYTPGVSGWTLNKDGSFELGGGTFRGDVYIIGPSGAQMHLYNNPSIGGPDVEFTPELWSGSAGDVYAITNVGPPNYASLYVSSPAQVSGGHAYIELRSGEAVTPLESRINLNATRVVIPGDTNGFTTDSFEVQVDSLITAAKTISDTNGVTYLKGKTGTATVSNAAATSFNFSVTYPVAFPVGTVPTVMINVLDNSAQTLRWVVKAFASTNTGFTALAANPIGAAANAWTNIPVQWSATIPG